MSKYYETFVYDEKMERENIHKEALKKKQEMQKCPICGVYESLITNVHCVKEHGLTKKEVEAEYGEIMTHMQRSRYENQKKRELTVEKKAV